VTTVVKPPPPHGSDSRYKGNRTGTRPPCRCLKCRRGHRQADAQRELRRLRGERNLVPRAEILPHIQMLRASGMSQTLIARQASVSQAVISYVTTGRTQNCQTEKARRILAVQPHRFDGNAERPAIGSIRRVRALYSLGHSRRSISNLSGLSVASISLLAEARWKVIDNLAATALANAYRQLINTRGTNWKNERRAATEKWPGPMAWDDIDDPAAEPDIDPNADKRGRPAEVDAIEVARLTALGKTSAQIAAQLGCHQRTVVRARGRIATNDLKEAA
jgi:hypothetical protein